jgi:hypothetical protein
MVWWVLVGTIIVRSGCIVFDGIAQNRYFALEPVLVIAVFCEQGQQGVEHLLVKVPLPCDNRVNIRFLQV